MNCEQARQTILESFDGPIRAELHHAIDNHVATCEACRRFAEVQQMLDARLTEALPPAYLGARFRTSLRRKLAEPATPRWSESLPDVAHLGGCAAGIIVLLFLMPKYASTVLLDGAGVTAVTYFLQAVLRRLLERQEYTP
jgi:predicted anti-sigma-YlaC factor YlaD